MKLRVEDLTLREKIGQTVIFRRSLIEKIDNVEAYFTQNPIGCLWATGATDDAHRVIESALGNAELVGRKDLFLMNTINTINKHTRIPVLPATDASQGLNPGIFDVHPGLPSHASIGATQDPELAYRYGNCLAKKLRSLGFCWLWSPVADNAGCYIGTRPMSCDYETNKQLLPAFIKGVQAAGVATSAKHFPGADPYDRRDSHFCTSGYHQSYETWEQTQYKEFKVCIDAGVDSIMIAHKTFKAVDDTNINGILIPATISHKILTGLLKERLGFDGVLLSDDADMKGLTAIYPEDKLYVEMLKAGIDMVLGPIRLDYIDIIEAAVQRGELSESRIDDACRRVLKLKEKYGLLEKEVLEYPTDPLQQSINDEFHAVAEDIAKKGLTMTANRVGFIPVDPAKIRKVKIVYIGYSEAVYKNLQYAVEEFQRHGAQVDIQNGFSAADNKTIGNYDLILYATYINMFAPAGPQYFFGNEVRMMRLIMTQSVEKSIGVSFGCSDIYFNYFTAARTFVNAYSYNPETMVALVKGIYGEQDFTDYSPYPLNPITRTNEVF